MTERRNTVTSLIGCYYDTRGIVRGGVNPIDARVNTGPLSMEERYVNENTAGAVLVKDDERRPYVSIDIETTGLDYSFCQVLEFGAVIDDYVTPLDKLPRFHAYIVHDRIQGEPFALALNAEILRRIANRSKPECAGYTFIEPQHLAGMFSFWVASWGAGSSAQGGLPIIPSGKNFQGFDRPFLRLLPEFNLRVNMIHRCIDPSMLYWDAAKDQLPPSTKECYERAGITEEVAHTAVEDCFGIIRLIRHKVAQSVPPVMAFVNGDGEQVPDPRPQSAKELAHKLSDHFQQRRQFTGQR